MREWILLFRQRLGRLAKVGFRDFADLKAVAPFHFARDRTAADLRWSRSRHRIGDETECRPLAVKVLAQHRLLHLVLAAALGKASPVHRQPATSREQELMKRQEDRAE